MAVITWPEFARRVLRRWPGLERRALTALDLGYRAALLPFRRPSRAGGTAEALHLVERTDAYNRAAEKYFAEFDDKAFLLDKPYSDLSQAPKHLIDAGVLIRSLRLRRGDSVLELGAGSCWLSHMLNRCGCRTVAVDVSETALALGRTVFERDPRTDWSLDPRFLLYDGRRLPLDEGSCDRVVVNDAFHHVPNQRELLLEMHRVLRSDGLVAMSEPGAGHGTAGHSVRESATTGVLENELVLSDLAALAEACGFTAARLVVTSPYADHEIPARELPAFMGGRGFARYWKTFCSALEQHHYLLLYKGPVEPTTRRPGRLSARIDVARGPATVAQGEALMLTIEVTNTGDTLWLAGEGEGWTRIGAHLYSATGPRQLIDFDWGRWPLPHDVPPGGRIQVAARLPVLPAPGDYSVILDLVVEGLAWFADRGSSPAMVRVRCT